MLLYVYNDITEGHGKPMPEIPNNKDGFYTSWLYVYE